MAAEIWTIQRILDWTREHFTKAGIDSARLDAELLLADTLGVERITLYTHFDKPLNDDERARFRERVKRRAAREPVAYILGRREFFGRDFEVTRDVLVPRPETEHVVEQALTWVQDRGLAAVRIIDVGTGSGAIAVSLACELPGAQVAATDISAAALSVARRNADKHGARVEFLEGDLLAPVTGRVFDVVVSNPPYVEASPHVRLERDVVDYEPHVALFGGGAEGMGILERLCAGVAEHVARPGLFLCEIDSRQRERVSGLLERAGWSDVTAVHDLADLPRVIRAVRPSS